MLGKFWCACVGLRGLQCGSRVIRGVAVWQSGRGSVGRGSVAVGAWQRGSQGVAAWQSGRGSVAVGAWQSGRGSVAVRAWQGGSQGVAVLPRGRCGSRGVATP